MEHQGNYEGIDVKFDDWIDVLFEKWLKDICTREGFTVEQYKKEYPNIVKEFHSAFRDGWLACENYYS